MRKKYQYRIVLVNKLYYVQFRSNLWPFWRYHTESWGWGGNSEKWSSKQLVYAKYRVEAFMEQDGKDFRIIKEYL